MDARQAAVASAVLSALAFAGACSGLRWSGHHRHEDMGPGDRIRQNTRLCPDFGLEGSAGGGDCFEIRASTGAGRAP